MIGEKLPFDIVYTIFEELSLQDRVRCTGVSRQWRDILLNQWSDLWRHIEYTTKRGVTGPSENYGFPLWLSNAPADNVRSLACTGEPAFHVALVHVLYRKRFPQLKTLRLINNISYMVSPVLDPRRFLADQLECLEVVRFRLPEGYDNSPALPDSHLLLEHLSHLRWLSNDPLSISLIKQCSNLRSLVVWNYAVQDSVAKLVADVHRWCPHLKDLTVPAKDHTSSEDSYQRFPPRDHDTDKQLGLEKLVLQPYWYNHRMNAADLVFRNRNTLLHLDIVFDDLHRQPSLEMPYLRHLRLANSPSNQRLVLEFLTCCPQLQSLHLTSLWQPFDAHEPRSAEVREVGPVPLPYLQTLALDECSCLDDDFLHSLDTLNALTEVSIHMCFSFTDEGKNALLAKAPSLKAIKYL